MKERGFDLGILLWFGALTATQCGCHGDQASTSAPSAGYFREITAAIRLPADREPWPDGQFHTPEITPGGVALFDYDADGDLDIYQVRHPKPGEWPAAMKRPAPNRLYRQEADGKFVDVTKESGLGDPGFGHGVAVGDTDNDGDLDVYVTNLGQDAFYRNNGDGTFTNVTQAAGITQEDRWSSSAAFLDYDRDGDLDLYVTRFAVFDPQRKCKEADGKPDYCGPHIFDGIRDTLYRNNGDGTFSDVTAAAKIDDPPGRGWGVVCADYTGDGWIDIYVANDEEPNQLWINQHDGTFVDEAVMRGCAVNGMGKPEASMGVCAGDVDGSGKLALFMTHIVNEKNTLYTPVAANDFTDASAVSGLAAPSIPMTGWGCGFLDYDLDGDLDLAVANGRVNRQQPRPGAELSAFWNQFAEPNQLFENDGHGKFKDASKAAGDFTRRIESTRGLAFGDLDNDGDIDLVTNDIGNMLRVYRNDTPRGGNHWLAVRPMIGKRDAYGAVVTVKIGKTISRIANPGYSYLASNDPRAHFGLGTATQVDEIEVLWPDGSRETFPGSPADRLVKLAAGGGQGSRSGKK